MSYFSAQEQSCKCCGVALMEPGFMIRLNGLRKAWGQPMQANSMYRCPTHNAAVGGKLSSWHTKGRAIDIGWSNMPGGEKLALVELARKHGFTGIGIHRDFVHLDDRPGTAVLFLY